MEVLLHKYAVYGDQTARRICKTPQAGHRPPLQDANRSLQSDLKLVNATIQRDVFAQ